MNIAWLILCLRIVYIYMFYRLKKKCWSRACRYSYCRELFVIIWFMFVSNFKMISIKIIFSSMFVFTRTKQWLSLLTLLQKHRKFQWTALLGSRKPVHKDFKKLTCFTHVLVLNCMNIVLTAKPNLKKFEIF